MVGLPGREEIGLHRREWGKNGLGVINLNGGEARVVEVKNNAVTIRGGRAREGGAGGCLM